MLHINANITESHSPESILALGVDEVVLSHQGLSKDGDLEGAVFDELCQKMLAAGLKVTLAVDRMVEQRHFEEVFARLPQDRNLCLRLSDIGLAQRVFDEREQPFQLSLESGFCNSKSIPIVCEHFKGRLDRVVLNREIEKTHLLPILKSLHTPSEILGLGSILLYSSPRKLLSGKNLDSHVFIQSPEMGRHRLEVKESKVATNIYHQKELCLLKHLDELEENSLDYFRLDLRGKSEDQLKSLVDFFHDRDYASFKESWDKPLLSGYYRSNRSDALFHHLPKHRMQGQKKCVAEVIDFSEGGLLVQSKSRFSLQDELSGMDKEGHIYPAKTRSIKSLEGENLDTLENGEMAFISRFKGCRMGMYLYR